MQPTEQLPETQVQQDIPRAILGNSQPTQQNDQNKMKRVSIVIMTAIAFSFFGTAFGYYLGLSKTSPSKPTDVTVVLPSSSPTAEEVSPAATEATGDTIQAKKINPTTLTQDWQTYKNTQYNYSFKHPVFMKISAANMDTVNLNNQSAGEPAYENSLSFFTIRTLDEVQQTKPNEYCYIDTANQSEATCTNVSNLKKVSVAGTERAYLQEGYLGGPNGEDVENKTVSVMIVHNNKVYFVTAQYKTNDGTARAIYDGVVESFTVPKN